MGGARSVVTIGNFDGLHLGHQELLSNCHALADDTAKVAVVTFEPLPGAVFSPENPPARLTTVYQKLDRLQTEGVDLVWLIRFDRAFSRLPAREFVHQVLVEGLRARHVVVGADFHFGHRREGDVPLLRQLGKEHGFGVTIVPAVYLGDERVSSSLIRGALAAGDLTRAATMLGRPFRMEGRVVRGEQLGRKLGYATANLRVRARPAPLHGIFAVYARAGKRQHREPWRAAVSSIGWRPAVGGKEPLLEVHFFDFEGDLYGQRLEVEFVAKLRDEVHFERIEDMVAQMRRDEAAARDALAQTERPA